MALSGIQIYKLLPQTNCKECGFPTCLAFAMKLAAKQVELSSCPYVTDESKAQLAESSAPPIRLINLKSDGNELKVGNEVVLFRHEKTFYNRPGLFVTVRDDLGVEEIQQYVAEADAYKVNYVGMDLTLDGFAVRAVSGDPDRFAQAIRAVRQVSKRPLILISHTPEVIKAGLAELSNETPLISAAREDNWEAFVELANTAKAVLVAEAPNLEDLAALSEKIKGKGVEDIVLLPSEQNLSTALTLNTEIRRLAIKEELPSTGLSHDLIPSIP